MWTAATIYQDRRQDRRRPAGTIRPDRRLDRRRPAGTIHQDRRLDRRRPAGTIHPDRRQDRRRPAVPSARTAAWTAAVRRVPSARTAAWTAAVRRPSTRTAAWTAAVRRVPSARTAAWTAAVRRVPSARTAAWTTAVRRVPSARTAARTTAAKRLHHVVARSPAAVERSAAPVERANAAVERADAACFDSGAARRTAEAEREHAAAERSPGPTDRSPPQWRIAPPTQPPTGVAGKPPGRRQGSAPVIPANEDRFVRDEVLVEFRPDVSPQAAFDIAMRERLTLVASQRLELIDSTINRYQILDGRSVPEVVAALARDPNIVSTQPNYLYTLQQEERGSPQKPYPRARMHLDAAHSISEGGGTLVAVIDTIIDPAHPEIAGSIADSVDLIRADPKPDVKGMETYENALVTMSGGSASEPYVHGTAIAGVIAAHGELTGVAPKARILAVRAFAPRSDGRGAQGTTHNIVTGIDWAFKHGARVVNLSFGGPRDELLSDALASGVARRMIFVASVGNEGEKAASLYPAADENVIAATASDEKDGVFKRANHCPLACVAAPGVDLRVAAPPAEYRTASGTSLAAAHIAGVVALVLDKRSDLEPRKVREALFDAAKRSSRAGPTPRRRQSRASSMLMKRSKPPSANRKNQRSRLLPRNRRMRLT